MPMLVLLLIAVGLSVPSRAPYEWPIRPARVVRPFDPPAEPWLPGHRGVDLAAAPGAVVHAAGAGRVVYADVLAGRGVVSVEHPGGLRTTYEPVTPSVAAGDSVLPGAVLGAVEAGHPGCPVAACLHWGLRQGSLYLDPLALLGLGRVRLLPSPALSAGPSWRPLPLIGPTRAPPASLPAALSPLTGSSPALFAGSLRCVVRADEYDKFAERLPAALTAYRR